MKKIFLILITISLLGAMGCKKGFLDVNTNPNQSTSANPALVLPAALNVTVGNWYPGPTAISEWMGSWAVSGSFAINGNDVGTTYKMTTAYGDGLWTSVYDNLEDYQYIQDASMKNNQPFYEGVARIMKVVNYQHLVDLFNDIPYTEALKGSEILSPKYTKGSVIYDSLFIELQRGITLIKSAGVTASSTSDIMFGGDKTKWIQFANTERLKMLLRMSELSAKPASFQPNVTLTAAEPAGFLTTDALVQPGYLNSTGQGNPFWQRFYNLSGQAVSSFGDFWAANQFSVAFYKDNADPRLGREVSPVPGTTNYVGNKLGLANGNPVNGKYSIFGPGILKGATAPAVMMLAAESYFLQAEAAALGYIAGADADLYKSGILASFNYLGVPDYVNAFNTWYTSQAGNPKVDYATATSKLAKQTIILRQKWAAEVSINSTVSYADYRKFNYLHTGTPPYPGPLGDTPFSFSPYIDLAKIPLRLKYPASEYAKNADNVNALGTIDHQTSKIWWMQ
ncbi:MAG: SusD/RagB family nutrient-binding outer membrane lipoprotein [Ginsengibacter sp.]